MTDPAEVMGRQTTDVYECCPCCGDPCQFMQERDKHLTPCPVCEECPDCGGRHEPTTAFAVRSCPLSPPARETTE